MSIQLPRAIELYFAAESARDARTLDRCFAPHAIVRDEAKMIEGLPAIRAWRAETSSKYRHSVEPLAMVEREGKVVVTGRVSGSFPGSPIELDHIFELDGDKIVALEIRP